MQDDAGLDYAALASAFTVRLYGRFNRPHHSFDQGLQRSMTLAYGKNGAAKALPFRFGYEKALGSAIQVAVRGSETARTPGRCAPPADEQRPAPVKSRRAD